MTLSQQLQKLLAPLKRRIQMAICKIVIESMEMTSGFPQAKGQAYADEELDGLDIYQDYGFAFKGVPSDDEGSMEGIGVATGGDRQRTVIVKIHDRRYFLTDLGNGEVAMYTHEDQLPGRHRVHFKAGQVIDIRCKEANIISDKATLQSGDVEIGTGTMKKLMNDAAWALVQNHVHGGVQNGPGFTLGPNPGLSPGTPPLFNPGEGLTSNTEAS